MYAFLEGQMSKYLLLAIRKLLFWSGGLSSFLHLVIFSVQYLLFSSVTTIHYFKSFAGVFLKLVSAIFIKFLLFHQMIALQKLWKMVFISSKKLFSISRYSLFVFLSAPFSTCRPLLRGWSKINLKVHNIINCLTKNSITYFVWYLGKEKGMTMKLCL